MKQNTIILIIARVLLIGAVGIFFLENTHFTMKDEVKGIVNASLVIEDPQYDFGVIDINGGDVTTEFAVTNTGEEPVEVLDGTTSCACTSAQLKGIDFDMHNGMVRTVTIMPGETKTLTATYDPLFHGPKGTGKITRDVILKTNSVTTPEIRARFKADVVSNKE